MRARFSRPIFGPFRRRTRTGVPADHFPKASKMYGDGVSALVADGPAEQTWWFADEVSRQAFTNGLSWVAETDSYDNDVQARILAELAEHGASDQPIEGGVSVLVRTSDPLALHKPITGVHSHAHSHNGKAHTHSHFHNDSASHNHSHAQAVITEADRILAEARPTDDTPDAEPVVGPVTDLSHLSEAARREVDADNEITDPAALEALVASAFEARGGLEALAKRRDEKGVTAATLPDGTVEPGPWHAYLCAEGIRTDDGRELMLGSCRYPDLPVSLRLLIEDEGGHWGAVTCGRIDTMEPRDVSNLHMHYATGVFGSDPNGQLAELMVEEQTQRFVSIDPRDVTCEWVEVVVRVNGDDDCCEYDGWTRYSDLVIGAATVVPMPALPQAVITPAGVALPDAPIATESAPAGLIVVEVDDEPTVELDVTIAASGAIVGPPAEWFDDPGFHIGDPRLVTQADGKSLACPLYIGPRDPASGRREVLAHLAWWNCEHTAFRARKVKPPRSESGYAYYLTGPGVECAGGKLVEGVGQITMGCGHAPMTKPMNGRRVPLSAHETIAHYDGGYGAIQAADVRAGQDDFGPWVHGATRADVTDQQVDELMALSLSGDWREIAGRLDLVAVLAVPVPGFPIRRAIAASGAPEVEANDFHAGFTDDRLFGLVAAGVVRRVDPATRIAFLENELTSVTSRLSALEASESKGRRDRARERHGI